MASLDACKGIIALILIVGTHPVWATTDQLESLLQGGKAQKAYELALEMSITEAGNPQFDFLYGLAAIEAGHPERAIFPLERVLLAEPANMRARLELGRAHYLLGELDAAREYFNDVLAVDPPPNVRTRIAQFLASIEARDKTLRAKFMGYAEFKLGTDSNVNSATDDDHIVIPALGQVSLNGSSQELSDEFAELRVSLRYEAPRNKRQSNRYSPLVSSAGATISVAVILMFPRWTWPPA